MGFELKEISERKIDLQIFILFVLTAFVSCYFYFRSFGFYEDDYYHITLNLKITFSDLLEFISIRLTNWFQGHPLAFFPSLFTYLGMRSGGIATLYIFGCMILSVNAFLFYRFLTKLYPDSKILASAAGLMFILFPANSTKIFLTYSFTMQLSLTFFIIACILYFSDKEILAYVFIIFSLFLYEPVFIIFIGIPLLKLKNPGKARREFLKHVGVMLAILTFTFIIRRLMSESRIEEVINNLPGFAKDSISGMIYGTITVLKNLIYTPLAVTGELNYSYLFFFVSGFILIGLTFAASYKKNILTESYDTESTQSGKDILRLLVVSVILIMLSYSMPLLKYPVTTEAGRMSSVHTSAVIGISILFGLFCKLLTNASKGRAMKVITFSVVSIYLSFLFVFNVIIQKDYSRSWEIQKDFWTEVKRLCPDLKDSTVVFAVQSENNKIRKTKYISSNSWLDPIILKQIYQFPDYWKNPPRLFVMTEDWKNKVFLNNGKPEWKVPSVTWVSHNEELPDSNLIILKPEENYKLLRDYSSVSINEKILNLRPENSPVFKNWKKGILDSYLIRQ